jgi:hypothetical protein
VTNAATAALLLELGETARQIAGHILAGYRTADELVATTGLPVAAVLATLTVLEARGLIVGVYGRFRPVGALAIAADSGSLPRVAPSGPGTARGPRDSARG